MAKEQTLLELAELVSSNTKALVDYLKKSGRPEPSFAPGGPNDIIPDDVGDIQKIRSQLVAASRELADLAMGPLRLSLEFMLVGVRQILPTCFCKLSVDMSSSTTILLSCASSTNTRSHSMFL